MKMDIWGRRSVWKICTLSFLLKFGCIWPSATSIVRDSSLKQLADSMVWKGLQKYAKIYEMKSKPISCIDIASVVIIWKSLSTRYSKDNDSWKLHTMNISALGMCSKKLRRIPSRTMGISEKMSSVFTGTITGNKSCWRWFQNRNKEAGSQEFLQVDTQPTSIN